MSYKQKKFETPIELHETLGNKYMVDLLKRKQLRKKEKVQQTAARNAHPGHGGMAFYPNNQYFDEVMLNKQLQLEMELERLRGMQSQPIVSNMFDNSAPNNDVVHTPMQQHLLPLIHTPMIDPLSMSDTNINVPSENIKTTQNVQETVSVEPHPTAPTATGAPPKRPPRSKKTKSISKRKNTTPKENSVAATDKSEQSSVLNSSAGEDQMKQNTTEIALADTNLSAPVGIIPSASPLVPSGIGPPMGLSGASTPQQPTSARSTALPILPASAATTTAPLRTAATSINSAASGLDFAQVGFGLNPTHMGMGSRTGTGRQISYALQYTQRNQLLSPWQANGTPGVQYIAPSPAMLYSPPTGIATGESSIYSHNYVPRHSHFSHYDAKGRNPSQPQYEQQSNHLNMFVLSAAPNLSYQHMLSQDMQHHQDQLQQQEQSRNIPNSNPLQAQPLNNMHSPGSLSMNLDRSMSMSDEEHDSPQPSIARSEMTIQEQIHRFAEIRSLFQLPSNTDFEDTSYTLQHPYGSELDTASSVQYFPANRKIRTDLMDELAQTKLKESVDKHKQRLERSRQPKSRPNGAMKQSPRARIHKPRSGMANTPRSDYYYGTAQDKPHTTGHSFPNPSHSTTPTSITATAPVGTQRMVAAEFSTPNTLSVVSSDIPTTTAATAESNPAVTISSSTDVIQQQNKHTTPDLASTTNNLPIQEEPSSSNQLEPPSGETRAPAPVRELSLEEFERETARIEENIRQTIESSVEEEILLDSQSRHYTKRMRLQTLAKSKKPLEMKITAKVDEKLHQLKKELEELKLTKINLPLQQQQQHEGSGLLEESCSEEGEEVGGVPLPPPKESWFLRNELTGSPKPSPKASAHKQFNSALPATTTTTPTTTTANKQSTSIDYQIITQDIKKSIEKVIKRHIKTHPGMDSAEVEHMLFGSQLEGLSRDTYDDHYYHTVGAGGGMTPQNSIISSVGAGMRRLSEESTTAAAVMGGAMALRTVPEEPTSTPKSLPQGEEGGILMPPISPTQLQRKQTNTSSSNMKIDSEAIRPAAPTTTARAPLQTAKSGSMLSSLGSFFSSKSNISKAPSSRFKPSRQVSSLLQSIPNHEEQNKEETVGEGEERVVIDTPEIVAARRQEEIQRVQKELQETSDQLNVLNSTKAQLKKELKEWQKDFKDRVGRPPSDADKSAIEDRFLFYKKLSADGKETLRKRKQLEDALQALLVA